MDFLSGYLGSMNGRNMGHVQLQQRPWTLSPNTLAKPWNFTTSWTLMGQWSFVMLKYTFIYVTFLWRLLAVRIMWFQFTKPTQTLCWACYNVLTVFFFLSILKKSNIIPSEDYYKVSRHGMFNNKKMKKKKWTTFICIALILKTKQLHISISFLVIL